MIFAERYKKYCKIRGLLPSSQVVAEQLGCTRQNIATIIREGSVPSANIVINAAKMLNVSTDYLLGVTDTPSPYETILTEEECELISSFRDLNSDGKLAAKSMICGLLGQDLYKKSNQAKKDII